MYPLDTDWVLEALDGRRFVLQYLEQLSNSPVFISLVSVGETYEGAFDSANPEAHLLHFRRFLSAYRVLPLTDEIMEEFAEVRSTLRRRGQLLADFDLLIAATALHHDLTLLTFNRRHFERVPDLRLFEPQSS